MRIGCLGMATLDTLLFTSEAVFAEETVTPVEEAVVCPGGKGIVTAIAMAEAGAGILPFALLGRSSRLRMPFSNGIDDSYLLPRLRDDNRTWITVSEGQKVVTFVARGALEEEQDRVASAVESFARQVDAIYVTIEEISALRAVVAAAGNLGLPIALNASLPLLNLLGGEHPELLAKLVRQSQVILCNDWEAPQLLRSLGVGAWSDLDAGALEEVVVTSGAAGGHHAVAPFEEWQRFEATPASRLRCVVGAGDTFNGGYLAARWLAGTTPAESCRKGADLAALKVAHRGSALPSLNLRADS